MRSLGPALLLPLVLGCGPDFTGAYHGLAGWKHSCSDGTSTSTSYRVFWRVVQEDAQLTIDSGDYCGGELLAHVRGDTATLLEKVCFRQGSGSDMIEDRLVGGSLVFTEADELKLVLSERLEVTGNGAVTCTGTLAGAISRSVGSQSVR